MIRAYHQPTLLEEALALVSRGAIPVAGATGLYSGRSRRDVELVDIMALGLDTLETTQTTVELGATLTLQQIAAASNLPGMQGALLRRCTRGVASRPLRNMITVGGNLAHLVYWADLPVVLLALEASLEVRNAAGEVTSVPIADALRTGKRSWEGALITKVIVPRQKGVFGFGYERFVRTVTDYSLCTLCATLRSDHGIARDVHLVVGAATARPIRMQAAEAALEGQAIDDATLAKAADCVAQELVVAPNYRAPSEYRRDLTAVLARRALATAGLWASREEE